MKRTAVFHWHRIAGATFLERHGWEIPAFFAGPEEDAAAATAGAGLADVGYLQKLEFREAQPGSWKLGSQRHLVVAEPAIEIPAAAWDVTSVYTAFRLIGPRSRDVLRKATSLNVSDTKLENGSAAQSNVAHVHTIVLRDDVGPLPSYMLLASREYGESMWENLLEAGHEFHIAPIGIQALERLRL